MSTRLAAAQAAPAPGRDWLGLAILWAVATAANLFKPFHVDDTAHLTIARWIARHPLHPMSGPLNWNGVVEPIHTTNQPHLYFYLLAGWSRLFGFSEPAMHSLQALAALACILLFHRLARRLAAPVALWATALLVLSPAFLVEQNLMVDTPLLAAWLAVFNPLVCDVEAPRQDLRYGLAATACSAALLIKYSSLALLPILGLSLVLERRWRQAWTLLIPLGVLAAWSGFNWWDYGGAHIAERTVSGAGETWRQAKFLVAWLVTLGGVTPLGLVAALQARPAFRHARIVYVAAAAALLLLALAVAGRAVSDRVADKLLWAAFMANALAILAALAPAVRRAAWPWPSNAAEGRARAPVIYLLLWVAGTSAFYILLSPFVATRHVLLILPPLILLLAGRWGRELTLEAKAFALAATAVVAAGLGLADWRFAEFYRVEAHRLASEAPPGARMWISGHFGLQWYAQQAGLAEVDVRRSRLQPGDILAVARRLPRQPLVNPPPLLPAGIEVQAPDINPFCTARAWRFYASSFEVPPWSLSRNCGGRIDFFLVTAGR